MYDRALTAAEINAIFTADTAGKCHNAESDSTGDESWQDNVYLSVDESLDNSDILLGQFNHVGALKPGEGYSQGEEIILPNGISGDYFLLVKTDAEDDITEFAAEGNNVLSHAIKIELAPTPDLVVTEVVGPNELVVGNPAEVTVSWTVVNQGTSETGNVSWTDRLILSSNTVLGDSDDIVLGEFLFDQNVAEGGSSNLLSVRNSNIGMGGGAEELFALPSEYATAGTALYAAVGDLNGDGIPDIVAVNHLSPSSISVLIGNGDGTFLPQTEVVVGGEGGVSVELADFNRDGNLDVVAVSNNPGVVSILPGNGDGTFGVRTDITIGNGATGVSIGDVDGDGNLDLAIGRADGVTILRGDGTGQFGSQADYAAGPGSAWVALGDLDGDGDLDLVASQSPGTAVSVFLGNGDGTLGTPTDAVVGSSQFIVRLADLDANGTLDLITANLDGSISVLPGLGDGTFGLGTKHPKSPGLGVAVGDLNKDGRLDLIASSSNAQSVSVLPGNGDLTFGPRQDFVLGRFAYLVLLADLDGDRDLDYVVPTWRDDSVLVGLNNTFDLSGDGPFSYKRVEQVSLPLNASGTFYLYVVTDADDAIYEHEAEDINVGIASDSLVVHTQPFADLVVSDITVPAAGNSGRPITVNWSVKNQGLGTTNVSSWRDQIVLSSDAVLGNADDVLLTSVEHTGSLAINGNYSQSLNVTLPNGIQGDRYIFVTTDVNNSVDEFLFDDNNTRRSGAVAVSLTPPPDLQVTTITIPPRVLTAGTIDVTWEVSNLGSGDAEGSWTDRVYLSDDNQAGGDVLLGTFARTGGLAPSGKYTVTQTHTLSELADGDYYIVVVTDIEDDLFEHLSEGNNTSVSSSAFAVVHPDLQVTSITVPAETESGTVVPVEWTVTNTGTGESHTVAWRDAVFLSTDNILDGSDTLLDQFDRAGQLNAGDSYVRQEQIVLPDGIFGSFFLLIRTDDQQQVIETGAESNNVSSAATNVTLSPYADLIVQKVTVPTDIIVGNPAEADVSWTVINQGTGQGRSDTWTDRIVLSANSIFGDSDDRFVANIVHQGAVPVGESYTQTQRIQLPANLAGEFTLFVMSDSEDDVFEYEFENNNVGNADDRLAVTASPAADLVVTSVDSPATGKSGQLIEVGWSVRNRGQADTNSLSWTDAVFLSSDDQIGNSDDLLLGLSLSQGGLAGAEAYQQTLQVRLPEQIHGDHLLYVKTDSGNTVEESPFEFNNSTFSLTTLSIADVTGPKVLSFTPELVVGQPISQVTLTFDEEIKTASLNLSHVAEFVGPGGLDLMDDLTSIHGAGDEVTVTFSEQLLAGSYRLVIGPNVEDLSGNLMDQNEDDTLGQPDDTFTARIVLDPGPPLHIVQSTPANGTQATAPPATIEFVLSKPVDEDSVDVSDLLIDGGASVLSVATLSPTLLRFSLSVPDAEGIYSYQLPAGTLADRHGQLSAEFVGVFHIDKTAPEIISYSNSSSLPFDDVRIEFSEAPNQETFTSSDVALFDPEGRPIFVESVTHVFETKFIIRFADQLKVGIYSIEIGPDIEDIAGNTMNQVFTANVEVLGADLFARSISVPAEAQFGSPLLLSWTVENIGSSRASEDWQDRFWLSTDETLDAGDRNLASVSVGAFSPLEKQDDKYTRNRSVTLPLDATLEEGQYFVILETDALFQQPESDESNNSAVSLPFVITLPPLPDLVVGQIDAPTEALTGEPILIQWTVGNLGDANAIGTWTDRIFLSQNSELGDDILLASRSFTGSVEAGDSINRAANVLLPEEQDGIYYILIQLDAENNIFENRESVDAEDNHFFDDITIDVQLAFADLHVDAVTVSPLGGKTSLESGDPVEIAWRVRNDGNSLTRTRLSNGSYQVAESWVDRIFISNDANLDVSDDLELTIATHERRFPQRLID